VEFGKALTYPFDDDEWLSKLGIAVAVSLIQLVIPVIGLAPLYGWQVKLIKNVKDGAELPLPAWEDFGDYIVKGLMVLGANLLYQVPLILFWCVATIAGSATGGGLAAAVESGADPEAFGPVFGVIMACCGCLAAIYGIVAGAAFTGGLLRFADTETFNTFMEFGTNFGLVRDNLGAFIMALIYIILGAILFILASVVTLGLGSILLTAAMFYFSGHIMGQLAQQIDLGGEPLPEAV
jgi:hypothetical protein